MTLWGIISVEGVICCATAALLHLLGKACDRDAEYLKSIALVGSLKDLAPLLNAATKVLPLVVAVSGLVGSDNPIKCEYSDVKGVIVEKTEKHHFMQPNYKGEWGKETECISPSDWKSVPWYLDDSTDRVYVTGASCAASLPLTFGGKGFEESTHSVDCVKEFEKRGLKMLGVEKIERVLPLGKFLTVIGEASKDQDGTIQIRQTSTGRFYFSDFPLDKLIAARLSFARFCEAASVGLMVLGVCYLAEPAFKYIKRRRHPPKMKKRAKNRIAQPNMGYILPYMADATAHRNLPGPAVINTRQENKGSNSNADEDELDIMDKDLCRICLEREFNSVFIPCGHMCCCMACCLPLIGCPVCRAKIEHKVRTFRP